MKSFFYLSSKIIKKIYIPQHQTYLNYHQMNCLPKVFHLVFLNLNCILSQIQNQHLVSKIKIQKKFK